MNEPMEVTEEQIRRAEANRLAALEKRKRAAASAAAEAGLTVDAGAWRLFKCRKLPNPNAESEAPRKPPPLPPSLPPERFCAFLEICAADEFSVTPNPAPDSPFPGKLQCLRKIEECLSSVVSCCYNGTQSCTGKYVYKLKDYVVVVKCLKKSPGILVNEIPYKTLAVCERFSHAFTGNRWMAIMEDHLSDDRVNELVGKIPQFLRDALLPYQLEGVRYGLRRGGKCLIADEMGLGKSIQAIAIACCFLNEGPILVVCPASLRFSWAEELERWLPFLLPSDIHLVFLRRDNPSHQTKCPKVVVISYTMLRRLQKSMLEQDWALMIVDESHNIRCTKKSESEETKAVLDVATKTKQIILLSGTPSLSSDKIYLASLLGDHRPFDIFQQINMLWPGLLGKDKYEFAKNYCAVQAIHGAQGRNYMDFSKGTRLEELNVLLTQTLMIRRLKDHVMGQLPPKRRQVIRLMLEESDILSTTSCRITDMVCMDGGCTESGNQAESVINCCSHQNFADGCDEAANLKNGGGKKCLKRSPETLSSQELGIAKLSGFREWFSSHLMSKELDDTSMDACPGLKKMIIFAHHIKVLDGVQEFVCEKGIPFIRIDGSTLPRDRQVSVQQFRSSAETKIAIIGITAGGVGLDFSSAQNVVFLELPKCASEMLQAEDRAHRRGQKNAVNIYIFCAKGSCDESHWLHLNKSLSRVSSMMNGKAKAIQEIEVDCVYCLEHASSPHQCAITGETTDDLKFGKSVDENTQVFEMLGEKHEVHQLSQDKNAEFCMSSMQLDSLNCEDLSNSSLCMQEESVLCVNTDDGDSEAMVAGDSCLLISQVISVNCKVQAEQTQIALSQKYDGSETNTTSCLRAEWLRFEVSQNTGRVHLYACVPDLDSRPRPLSENFRPEELESLLSNAAGAHEDFTSKLMKENPTFWNACRTFLKEWNDLRPIERNKLLGKPLQLPLNVELFFLEEMANYGHNGLLRGGSKRRVTPLDEISYPLPEDAVWKNVCLHSGSKREKMYTQGWTLNEEPLCLLCQRPCNGKLAKEPEYFEDLFCGMDCFEHYRIRSSQKSLRRALFQIEHGVCRECQLDCHKLVRCINHLSIARRRDYVEKVAPKIASRKKLFKKLIEQPIEGNAWHADHIIPVYKGGGECRLENMRTLCVACHYKVTSAQGAERRLVKATAKSLLKTIMKDIKGGSEIHACSNPQASGYAGERDTTVEDELIIEVPGSAYSVQKAIAGIEQEENNRRNTETNSS